MNEIEKLSQAIFTRDPDILKNELKSAAGIEAYLNNYYASVLGVAADRYQATIKALGKNEFNQLFVQYLDQMAPKHYSIDIVADNFYAFLQKSQGELLGDFAQLDFYFTANKRNATKELSVNKFVLTHFLEDHPFDFTLESFPTETLNIQLSYDQQGEIKLDLL